MKAKDLASKLMENPEFDVEFTFVDYTERQDDKICMFMNILKFENIQSIVSVPSSWGLDLS